MDQTKNNLSVPMAILAAGILIAGALFFSRSDFKGNTERKNLTKNESAKIELDPVKPTEHVLGDLNAPIINVEYSDLECYFCRLFEPTAERLREEYGKKGQVAWVYRHFPLEDIHPRAKKAAIASECVAELGGNTKFWAFVSEIFKTSSPTNGSLEKLDMSLMAKNIGVNQSSFDNCLNSTKYDKLIQDSIVNGIKAGVNGTPRSFMVLKNAISEEQRDIILDKTVEYIDQQGRPLVKIDEERKIISLNGALPYEVFKLVIDTALSK
jgi:protein-disulfide isomerase